MDLTRRDFFRIGGMGALVGAGVASEGVLAGCSTDQQSAQNPGQSAQGTLDTIDFSAMDAGSLQVDAGWAYIKIDDYLPIDEKNTQSGGASYEHAEGYYSNVREGHDLRFNIVLIDFNDEAFAVYSIEHVNPTEINETKDLIAELTGVAADHQWFHNPHVLSAPHKIPFEAVPRPVASPSPASRTLLSVSGRVLPTRTPTAATRRQRDGIKCLTTTGIPTMYCPCCASTTFKATLLPSCTRSTWRREPSRTR